MSEVGRIHNDTVIPVQKVHKTRNEKYPKPPEQRAEEANLVPVDRAELSEEAQAELNK